MGKFSKPLKDKAVQSFINGAGGTLDPEYTDTNINTNKNASIATDTDIDKNIVLGINHGFESNTDTNIISHINTSSNASITTNTIHATNTKQNTNINTNVDKQFSWQSYNKKALHKNVFNLRINDYYHEVIKSMAVPEEGISMQNIIRDILLRELDKIVNKKEQSN